MTLASPGGPWRPSGAGRASQRPAAAAGTNRRRPAPPHDRAGPIVAPQPLGALELAPLGEVLGIGGAGGPAVGGVVASLDRRDQLGERLSAGAVDHELLPARLPAAPGGGDLRRLLASSAVSSRWSAGGWWKCSSRAPLLIAVPRSVVVLWDAAAQPVSETASRRSSRASSSAASCALAGSAAASSARISRLARSSAVAAAGRPVSSRAVAIF